MAPIKEVLLMMPRMPRVMTDVALRTIKRRSHARAQITKRDQKIGMEKKEKSHAFLTHNWGNDVHNRGNHKRGIRFKKELKKCGIDQT